MPRYTKRALKRSFLAQMRPDALAEPAFWRDLTSIFSDASSARPRSRFVKTDVVEWMENKISTLSLLLTEDADCPNKFYSRLLSFWADEYVRVDKFANYLDIIVEVCRAKLSYLIDTSNDFERAKVWYLTMITLTAHAKFPGSSPPELMLKIINDPKDGPNNYFKVFLEDIAHHGTNSKMKILEHFLCGNRSGNLEDRPISIRLVYDDSDVLEDSTWINPSITIKTLIRLIESRLQISKRPIHYRVELKVSSSQCNFAVNAHGGRLDWLGENNDHTVHIIPEYPGDVSKSAKRKESKKKKKRNKQTQSTNGKKASISQTKRNSAKPTMVADYVTTEDRDRLEHSNRLTLIFQEAAILFQERRQRLNYLALKKSSPKQKSLAKPIDAAPTQSVDQCSRDVSSKAGRTLFPILVGHEEYLYKSSKTARHRQVSPCSLDLYGCTRDEALFKLSSNLPNWLDAAMKELTYTLPVNIIAGGGSQIVAGAVENWIRESRNVAHRFC